jgi:4-deoxy-L-threo-5-hexosulose-uronate ketol-isomerase
VVTVDGEAVALDRYEALYVPMGAREVLFHGEGARFYLLSVPAHKAYAMRKLTLEGQSAGTRYAGDGE